MTSPSSPAVALPPFAIIEKQPQPTVADNSLERRSVALAQSSCQLLQQYGLWAELSLHACAIEQIQVSDRGHFGKTYLSAEQFGYRALGYVIEVAQMHGLQKMQKRDS